jgi:surfeit locus 1 family protein
VPVPAGKVEVRGLAALPPARFVELSDQPVTGNVFQNLTIDRFRRWSGLAVLPFELVADPPGEGLVAVMERPDAGAEQNRQYQATWFLLAATAAALWLGLNLKKAP